MPAGILYDVVDDTDSPIYQIEDKKILHRDGLVHRGVNVLFYTSNGEIILQKRALNKNTFPGLLDITVGGHVEQGLTYLEVAIREIEEETGLKLSPSDLQFIDKIRRSNHDNVTNTTSNYFCEIYAYKFDGKVEDLKIEAGKADGFMVKRIDEVLNLGNEAKNEYTPGVVKEDYLEVLRRLKSLSI